MAMCVARLYKFPNHRFYCFRTEDFYTSGAYAYFGVTLGAVSRASRASRDMGGVIGWDICLVSVGSRAYTAAWSSFAAGIDSPTISAIRAYALQ